LGALRSGSKVNLERPVSVDGRLGGHIVQGHVDGTGRLVSREPGASWDVLSVELPDALAPYVVVKGSITVEGVSLTVMALDDRQGRFSVSLIPATLAMTTLGAAQPGDMVNLEVDVLAKYVERLLNHQGGAQRGDRLQEAL
jgi:riboflavin synthase